MHEQQSRMAEEIEDLRSSLKKTVDEAVIEHKKSGDGVSSWDFHQIEFPT